jgi:hypothetical protein
MLMQVLRPDPVAAPRSGRDVRGFSSLERMAIAIGIKDGLMARSRSRVRNLFVFLVMPRPASLANPHLEQLRAYAELARALFPRSVPVTGLEEAGFTPAQIGELLGLIHAGA